jgi:16S rRNA processing protein RimM
VAGRVSGPPTTGMSDKRLVVIGQVAGPFGIKGEIKIRSFAESFDAFQRSAVLVFDESPYEVLRLRMHKGAALVFVQGIESPEDAAKLAGQLVKTDMENLPPKGEDEYYWFELMGMKVCTVEGRDLGHITRITPTGANDVLHVEGPAGEVLLPVIDEVVVSVDIAENIMIVDPLEGLIPDA